MYSKKINADSYCFFFFKGRVALYAILSALGLRKGDEVILPGFTCVVVPNAITYLGGKPVYVDIDRTTFNIEPTKIEEKITERTKAFIAQHTFGIPSKMDKIIELTEKHNLFLIEDSCHSIGSKYKGKEVGTFGDAAFFSSQWSKPITTGLGGWAVVNNPEVRKRLSDIYSQFSRPPFVKEKVLRMQYLIHSALVTPSLFWIAQNTYRALTSLGLAVGSSSNEELEYRMPTDYKMRMSDQQQKVLHRKLADIFKVNRHREWVTSHYGKFLPQIGIEPLHLPEEYNPVLLRYPVLVEDKKGILESAKKNNIEIGDWFVSPIHPNLAEWERVGYEKGMCPIAENICEHVINLPTHKKIGIREVEKIIKFLEKYGNKQLLLPDKNH